MYKLPKYTKTTLIVNQSKEGEMIEQKMERIIANKEPIKDGAPLIYTDRSEGVRPSTNPRTDRFEIAIEGMDKVNKSIKAKREEKPKTPKVEKEDGKAESMAGKGEIPTDGKTA